MRVVVALEPESAELFAGTPEALPIPEDLARALIGSFTALGAVVEGHVTSPSMLDVAGREPRPPHVERPPILFPRWTRRRRPAAIDAEIREREAEAERVEQAMRAALARGEPHAFVATDLLLLDGQLTHELPLLERKRLLESILTPSETVRISMFVQATSTQVIASWSSLGFAGLSYRGSNSRYLVGAENPDWAIVGALDPTTGATAH
jgi:hypothetical protein